jgi:putative nucleotidyltransferase with HDIG domain
MTSVPDRSKLAWFFGTVALLGLGVLVATRLVAGDQSSLRTLGVILFFLVLCAEFNPVEFHRLGLRLSFAAPYVACTALLFGPFWAMGFDMVSNLLTSRVLLGGKLRGAPMRWATLNILLAGICALLATLVARRVVDIGPEAFESAFILTYCVVNFAGVVTVESFYAGRLRMDQVARVAPAATMGALLYVVVGIVVGTLIRVQGYALIPLTMIPIWLGRLGVQYRARMDDVYYETIAALSSMLQHAHPYTHGHLDRVATYAETVALRLGLGSARARKVREAAVLHDIGKIAVDEEILDKPSKLNDEEMNHVRRHSEFGAQILEPAAAFRKIAPWIRHHHERPDGAGYPDRLAGNDIPIESRIIAVVDAFDAMVGDGPSERRPYRTPKTQEEALVELERCQNTQFDAAVVEAFVAVVREEKA